MARVITDPAERVRTAASLRKKIDPFGGHPGGNNQIDPFGAGGTGGSGAGLSAPMGGAPGKQIPAGDAMMMLLSGVAANKAGGSYNPPGYKSVSFGRGDRVGPPGGTGVFAYGVPEKDKKKKA